MSVFLKGYVTIIGSMLAGAAVVHAAYQPDLTLPLAAVAAAAGADAEAGAAPGAAAAPGGAAAAAGGKGAAAGAVKGGRGGA